MDKYTTEQLTQELEKRGFQWGKVLGHGSDEPVSNKDFVIGDVEKKTVLIKPEDLFEEPEGFENYF